jgi:predicted GNAT superfamily acetyltransferase
VGPAQAPRTRTAAIEINIPPDFQRMKKADINLARAWRMRTRLQFEEAFARGFAATDFSSDRNRTCYILTPL